MSGQNRCWIKPLVAAVVLSAGGAEVLAEERNAELEREIAALRAEVAEMRAKEGDGWLSQRRAEEVKALVHDVLRDAETRASLREGGLTAGWNKHFYLASEDGKFMLEIEGQIQPRYIWNSASNNGDDADDNEDETESGFQQRRTKVGFSGHIFDPKLEYKIKAGFDRDGGAFVLEEGYVNYEWADSHYVRLGQFKGRFLHEELVSSSKQQAVERSNVNEFFTLDYSQGVEVGGKYDAWNWSIVMHDGREADNVNFEGDATDFALAGRAELLVAGSWKQFGDFPAWEGEEFGLMVGAGADYENAEGGEGSAFDWEHMFQYTADASLEMHPFNAYAAYVGRIVKFDEGQGGALETTRDYGHQWGVVVQGGVFVIPNKLDLFARWEYLEFDGIGELTGTGTVSPISLPDGVDDDQHIFTFGGNYYFKKHDVKFTLDLVYAPEGVRQGESGAGIEESNQGDDDQIAIRGQFQLLF